jgi:hypothetical protein
MVNTIILHTDADADRANWLAQAWRERSCIACNTEAHGQRLSFGKHLVVVGIWSPATQEGAAASDLLRAVAGHRRRAFLLVWDLPEPPPPVAATGATIIFASGAREEDVAKLSAIAAKIDNGHMVATEYVPETPPERARAPVDRPSPGRSSWRRRREAELAAEQRRSVRPVDVATMKRARRWGYLIGAAVGLLTILGVLAPWAASLAK